MTVQIRNLDDDVTERLRARAQRQGLSLSEYLRRQLTDLAEQVELEDRWESLRIPGFDPTDEEIVAAIRADRDAR